MCQTHFVNSFLFIVFQCDNCSILQYRDQLRQDLIPMTRHIYVALIVAYARLGNFDMAKQVMVFTDENVL